MATTHSRSHHHRPPRYLLAKSRPLVGSDVLGVSSIKVCVVMEWRTEILEDARLSWSVPQFLAPKSIRGLYGD